MAATVTARTDRVAVVGTGRLVGTAARAGVRRPRRRRAVRGRRPRPAPAPPSARGEFGTRAYTDLDEMLDRERPDLVSVCLPNEEHFAPTLQVIRAGFPLFVEKPLVFDLAEADTLLAEAGTRGCSSASTSTTATPAGAPGGRRARPRRPRPARVRHLALRRRGRHQPHPHANLIETQCHGLDMLEHLCGPIASVMAQMTDADRPRLPPWRSRCLRQRRGRQPGRQLRLVLRLPGHPPLELNGTAGRVLIEDTVRRLHLQRRRRRDRQVWQAGYFNDTDRSSTTPSTATSTSCSRLCASTSPPSTPAPAGARWSWPTPSSAPSRTAPASRSPRTPPPDPDDQGQPE